MDPKKSETILDPACGTAGFLVAALKHLEEKYTSEDFKKMDKYPMDLLSPQERDFVYKHTFTGFDSDFDMFKFGLMNLYLHKLEHPNIKRQNTLVDTAGDRTKWDVILANPPFSGALDKDSISEDIKMNTSSTEILFLRYIMDHLSSTGRSGVIIPDGILFGDTKAHIYLRRKLIEECNLRAVVSLPVGVFLPYADASTAILFFDKTKKTDCVYFYRIFNDGYSLDDKRSPIKENDLPKALKLIKNNSTNNNGILIDAKTIIDNKYSLVQGDYEQKNGHIKNIPNGWKTILLSDVIQEIKTVAGENNKFPVLSITKYDGFVESEKYFNKQVFSKNTSKYKVVKKGQFAYSPIHIDEGAVGFMNNFEFGIISPMYKVFELKNKSNKIIDPLFLLQVLKSEQLIALFKSSGKGSVKRRKAVSFERFKNIELHIPPINRQLEISQLVINLSLIHI
ncbi:MAG: N-6 DNA methylase, partial [Candidatus Shapirobacteria bacterium]|nr:N-6 DNA methylase [Candidatus Shapirobacteria bacterium]